MSNIEEDVKTIKYRVDKCREEFEDFGEISFAYSDLDRIENILSEREQDKKRIKELEEENKSKQKAYDNCYCGYKQYKQFDSIPVQKVKDKIEHYKELQNNYIKKYDEVNDILQGMVNVLKELLEEK